MGIEYRCRNPVLFLTFNRLEQSAKVFERIRAVKPPKLYFASDGPRRNSPDEKSKVFSVRDYVLSQIDWNCDVKTLLRDDNLGCKQAVAGAIDWFFKCEEQGLILEDDCLPSLSFFRFCDELLEKYQHDTRVMKISGFNNLRNPPRSLESYQFTFYAYSWGWATWRRFWNLVDLDLNQWSEFKRKDLHLSYPFNKYVNKSIEEQYHAGAQATTWDFQMEFCLKANFGLSIVPTQSLTSNIGFGDDSTHTFDPNDYRTRIQACEIQGPLVHPKFVYPDYHFEHEFWLHRKKAASILSRVINRLKRLF